MSKYDNLWAPPTPEEKAAYNAKAIISSVQTSLFCALRQPLRHNAGRMAWALIRLVTPEHRDHDDAKAGLSALHPERRAALVRAISRSKTSKRATPEWVELLSDIESVLSGLPHP